MIFLSFTLYIFQLFIFFTMCFSFQSITLLPFLYFFIYTNIKIYRIKNVINRFQILNIITNPLLWLKSLDPQMTQSLTPIIRLIVLGNNTMTWNTYFNKRFLMNSSPPVDGKGLSYGKREWNFLLNILTLIWEIMF